MISLKSQPTNPPIAFTIPEFCAAHRFGPAHYYKLKQEGLGPREIKLGTRTIITAEAAAEWRRAQEERSAGLA
jgi:hypothetical protein